MGKRKSIPAFADEVNVTEALASSRKGPAYDVSDFEELSFRLTATENSGAGVPFFIIEDSFDDGVTWQSWISFGTVAEPPAQITAGGVYTAPPGLGSPDQGRYIRPHGDKIRWSLGLVGVGDWDVKIDMTAVRF